MSLVPSGGGRFAGDGLVAAVAVGPDAERPQNFMVVSSCRICDGRAAGRGEIRPPRGAGYIH
jgi:hypothetical protein